VSLTLSNSSFLVIFLRWHGSTGWLESLYGFPVGLGFGVSLSAAFIGLTARLKPSEVAVSTGGFYLSLNIGSLFGVGIASMLTKTFVERTLFKGLEDFPNREGVSFEPRDDTRRNASRKVAFLTSHRYYETSCRTWIALIDFQAE